MDRRLRQLALRASVGAGHDNARLIHAKLTQNSRKQFYALREYLHLGKVRPALFLAEP